MTNGSEVAFFILRGLSDLPQLQTPIFIIVLLIFILILCGNFTTFLLVCLDPKLHKPMYFFLRELSLLDMSYSTITLQNVFTAYLSGDKTISFQHCMSQMYFYSSLVNNEIFILTSMSYDRYLAICKPLYYPMVMNSRTFALLSITSFILGFTDMLPFTIIISHFTCFRSNEINHFFCDFLALMKLSCNDITFIWYLILIESAFLSLTPLIITVTSYVYIIQAILKIQTSSGRQKAFYTCSSHLTVVLLFYVTIICLYLRPTSLPTMDYDKLYALLYTAVTPLANPMIYTLRNEDVKSAFKSTLLRKGFLC
ncbi:olfactory receptor 5B2-like [Rhinophrynus dorsalis]